MENFRIGMKGMKEVTGMKNTSVKLSDNYIESAEGASVKRIYKYIDGLATEHSILRKSVI